jgi:hypothetical protein
LSRALAYDFGWCAELGCAAAVALSLHYFVGRDYANLADYLSPHNLWRIVFELHALRRVQLAGSDSSTQRRWSASSFRTLVTRFAGFVWLTAAVCPRTW